MQTKKHSPTVGTASRFQLRRYLQYCEHSTDASADSTCVICFFSTFSVFFPSSFPHTLEECGGPVGPTRGTLPRVPWDHTLRNEVTVCKAALIIRVSRMPTLRPTIMFRLCTNDCAAPRNLAPL